MLKTSLSYHFGALEIHNNFVIAVMKEGITVKPEYNKYLEDISIKYFKNKPFGYITNRKNSYSVDPRIYFETSKIKNLVAFSVVSIKKINLTNSDLERIFFKKPFKHFTELDNAIQWVNDIVKTKELYFN